MRLGILRAMSVFVTRKVFADYPCAHRQWRHAGHCKFVHGYSRSFTLEFGCESLSPEGFGVDFGGFKPLKTWLEDQFDHTCLINADDPELATFEDLHARQIVKLRVLPNVSMENTAKYVYDYVAPWITENTQGRAWLISVECRENQKNSGVYRP
ncbi:6-carboxytetrahydropterin synthase [Litorivicinus lipolyticus]|uniref:6-carboxy-5,6,7,8-tetrahydropterin synthase n=2 Tax=Litorivicinus lipolyticus TaxID=418701 RepID=A0A5Q2QFI4_9GAMM|nr:6-carboxytetrahydropterin synthase [Litorivicinus lipolyticus]